MALSSPAGTTRFTVEAEGAEADGLRQAAEALTLARHPGVPELIDVRVGTGRAALDLAVPDGVPLLGLALSFEEVAGVVATLATTIADLHDIGVAVGSVSVNGVVVEPDGHAVLTDVRRAVRLPGKSSQWPGHPLARRDDRDLGRLLTDLLDASAPRAVADLLDAPPIWARVLRRRDTPGATVRRLAERASGGGVASRVLADALATDVPGVRLPRRASPLAPPGREVAASPSDEALDRWFDAEDQPSAAARQPAAPPAGEAPPAAVEPGGEPRAAVEPRFAAPPASPNARHGARRRWPLVLSATAVVTVLLAVGRPSSASPRSLVCAPPGTACPAYREGILSVGGTRYAVGARGDVAATGRWSCGAALLALLRPATGEVWLYGAWPSGAASITPTLSAVVAGARRLAVVPGDHCDTLDVVRRDGARFPLYTGGAR